MTQLPLLPLPLLPLPVLDVPPIRSEWFDPYKQHPWGPGLYEVQVESGVTVLAEWYVGGDDATWLDLPAPPVAWRGLAGPAA